MKTSENTLSIFLVDDDPMFVSVLKHKLVEKFKSGIKISTFAGGEECLKHIDDKPDVVILDYYLDGVPGNTMNGLEVLQKIKSASDDTTVVMLSGQERKEVVEESMRKGAYKYVAKSETAVQTIQALVNKALHTMIQEKDAKENAKFNIVMTCIFIAILGLAAFLYFKYQ
ncbi:MAG TPA: response regulator [Bacteroidia bacterium]|jgi:DNA-binding NtrC family response regulator|nr:response regulator [Bacteroidia bacterium]